MRVYHGSSVEIIDIDLSQCELHRDFGKGFYVTGIREQRNIGQSEKGKVKNKVFFEGKTLFSPYF